jgi:hypothetical protein
MFLFEVPTCWWLHLQVRSVQSFPVQNSAGELSVSCNSELDYTHFMGEETEAQGMDTPAKAAQTRSAGLHGELALCHPTRAPPAHVLRWCAWPLPWCGSQRFYLSLGC